MCSWPACLHACPDKLQEAHPQSRLKESPIGAGGTSSHRWRLCHWPALLLPFLSRVGPPGPWRLSSSLTSAPQNWMHTSALGHLPPWNAIRHLLPWALLARSQDLLQISRTQIDIKHTLSPTLPHSDCPDHGLCFMSAWLVTGLLDATGHLYTFVQQNFASLNYLGMNIFQACERVNNSRSLSLYLPKCPLLHLPVFLFHYGFASSWPFPSTFSGWVLRALATEHKALSMAPWVLTGQPVTYLPHVTLSPEWVSVLFIKPSAKLWQWWYSFP